MYNKIMDAVTLKLSGLFPSEEGYTIYTDEVEQGLSEPCFFVQFLEPSEKPMLGPRYYRSNSMAIQYLPGEVPAYSRELNRVLEILMEEMRIIEIRNGRKINGTNRSGRIDDKVLTFLVQYNYYDAYETPQEETMETIEINS